MIHVFNLGGVRKGAPRFDPDRQAGQGVLISPPNSSGPPWSAIFSPRRGRPQGRCVAGRKNSGAEYRDLGSREHPAPLRSSRGPQATLERRGTER